MSEFIKLIEALPERHFRTLVALLLGLLLAGTGKLLLDVNSLKTTTTFYHGHYAIPSDAPVTKP